MNAILALMSDSLGDQGELERKSLLYQIYGFVCSGECALCQEERRNGENTEEDMKEMDGQSRE
jgi:hypothetical protein